MQMCSASHVRVACNLLLTREAKRLAWRLFTQGTRGRDAKHGRFAAIAVFFFSGIHQREQQHSQASFARYRRGYFLRPCSAGSLRSGRPARASGRPERDRIGHAVRPFHRQVQGRHARGFQPGRAEPFPAGCLGERQPAGAGRAPAEGRPRLTGQAAGRQPRAPHVPGRRRRGHFAEAQPCRSRNPDAPDRGQSERRIRSDRPRDEARPDAQRHQLQPAVGLHRRRRRHPRQHGVGRGQRQRHHRGGARHRLRGALRPGRQHRRRLRLHLQYHHGR